MKKTFKEYRMFLFCMVLFVVFVVASVYYFMNKDMARAIAMLIFTLIALMLWLGRFNIILFDDSMILYEWKFAAMLPIAVEYQDVQSIDKKSKHRVEVIHKHKTQVYVKNSDDFIKAYEELKK